MSQSQRKPGSFSSATQASFFVKLRFVWVAGKTLDVTPLHDRRSYREALKPTVYPSGNLGVVCPLPRPPSLSNSTLYGARGTRLDVTPLHDRRAYHRYAGVRDARQGAEGHGGVLRWHPTNRLFLRRGGTMMALSPGDRGRFSRSVFAMRSEGHSASVGQEMKRSYAEKNFSDGHCRGCSA